MALNQAQLESFARGARPGTDTLADINLDDEVEAMADGELHEEDPENVDADDTGAFEPPMSDFVHALEQHAEKMHDLALELTDDQIDAPSEDPSEEDKNVVMDHLENGELDSDLLHLAKEALPGLDAATAEQIGSHLMNEGMLEEDGPVVAYLLTLASLIDSIEVAEDADAMTDEEYDDEELEEPSDEEFSEEDDLE